MASEKLSRREFVCESALAAASVAVGLTATKTVHAGNPEKRTLPKSPATTPTWSTAAAARPT